MINVSRLADYAVVTLLTLSEGRKTMSAAELAEASRLPEPTVAKVLKAMARHGLVVSTRGASGGYALNFPPEQITLANVITAIDGPVALTACVEGASEQCGYAGSCPVHGRWDGVNRAIHKALDSVTLAEMSRNNAPSVQQEAVA